jgi:hypothetical protein
VRRPSAVKGTKGFGGPRPAASHVAEEADADLTSCEPVRPRNAPAQTDHAEFYAAAVYGTILAASLIAVFREEHDSPETIALALLGTMAVFWLAHAWSAILGERIHAGHGLGHRRAIAIARSEWPLVESAFAPAIVLVLGWTGLIGDKTSETLALAACIIQLFAWGFAVGRQAYHTWWAALLAGLGDGLLGLGLVWLEITVVH